MTSTRRRSPVARSLALAALAAAVGIASPADAQAPKKNAPVVLQPPTPPSGTSGAPWFPMLAGIVLLAMIVGVNCIPSKRGHQD